MSWLHWLMGKVESCVWLHLASYYMCMAHVSDANTSQVGVTDNSPFPVGVVAHPCPRRDYAAFADIVRAAAVIALAITCRAFELFKICSRIVW